MGSVANLIVAQRVVAQGIRIEFRRYAALGRPVTLVPITTGLLWLG